MSKAQFSKEFLKFINTELLDKKHTITVSENTKLFEKQIINSLKIIALIAYVEKKLRIRIPDAMVSMEHFSSVKTIVDTFYPHEKKQPQP